MVDTVDSEKLFMNGVKALRTQRGWSQQTLSDRLTELGVKNMGRGALAKVESGVRALRWHEALAIAAALGTDPAYLGSGGGETVDVQIAPELAMRGHRLRSWFRGQVFIKLDSDDVAPPATMTEDEWIEEANRQLESGFWLIAVLIDAHNNGEDIEPTMTAIESLAASHQQLKDRRNAARKA